MFERVIAGDEEISLQAVRVLIDLEAIKVLKARYCRFLDQKRWSELQNLFTDECTFLWEDDVPAQNFGTAYVDVARFMAVLQELLPEDATTVHHVHSPEITLESADTASGIWAMDDDYVITDVRRGAGRFRGHGHYEETYRRVGGVWKMASWRLNRIRVDQVA